MRLRAVLISALLLSTVNFVLAEQTVKIEFVVTVPADTPPDSPVFLAGNLPSLGPWKPDGLRLQRRDDGQYHAVLEMPRDFRLEYKITRGTWQTVEKGAAGEELANRTLLPDQPRRVAVRVARWASAVSADGQGARKSTLTGTIRTLDD
ncbi:MAG: CBM20 domain-containing protein, partial [Phycisphaerales bacterium]|nr:CBM20 domain-containing protein [Phycisphaerales bacterium]